MDFYKLISERESIRDYDPDRPVDDGTLNRILEAGRLAPSAVNAQQLAEFEITTHRSLTVCRCIGQGKGDAVALLVEI